MKFNYALGGGFISKTYNKKYIHCTWSKVHKPVLGLHGVLFTCLPV